MRFAIVRAQMRKLRKRDRKARCFWCRAALAGSESKSQFRRTRDHVIPKSKGGTVRVWCCYTCNQAKGALMPAEWMAVISVSQGTAPSSKG
jgi:5-methylcytosine-specific restriction endonuclease McrA